MGRIVPIITHVLHFDRILCGYGCGHLREPERLYSCCIIFYMDILESALNPSDSQFEANAEYHRALAAELCAWLAQVRKGGDEQAHARHREQGKLFVRERIDKLLDDGSPFLELSPLAAWGMYDGDAPCAGIVTGIGRVAGREVLIVANDATVKGGT